MSLIPDLPVPAGATRIYPWEPWTDDGTSGRLFDITHHTIDADIEGPLRKIQFSDNSIEPDIRFYGVDCDTPLSTEQAASWPRGTAERSRRTRQARRLRLHKFR